jgi:hypothetical protein
MNDQEPHPPDLARRLWNVAAAAADFARDGFALADEATYQARLAVCNHCELRQEAICTECGCYIKAKAAGRAWLCPIGRWDVPDLSVLPRQLQFTLLAENLPDEFAALAGSYALERQTECDVAELGRFQAVWQAMVPATAHDLVLARVEACEHGVSLRFFSNAGQASPLGWQRVAATIPFLLTGPMPLEPVDPACSIVTLWPA